MALVILEENEGGKPRDLISLCDNTENILICIIIETSFPDKGRNFHWSISAERKD